MKKFLLFAVLLAWLGCMSCSACAGAISLKLGDTYPADHPAVQADQQFARLVQDRTKGRVEVEVTGTLYSAEPLCLEALLVGDLAFARVSVSQAVGFAPALGVLNAPSLFKDAAHRQAALSDREIGGRLLDQVQAAGMGLIGLGFYEGDAPEILLGSEAALTKAGIIDQDVEILRACAGEAQAFQFEAWNLRAAQKAEEGEDPEKAQPAEAGAYVPRSAQEEKLLRAIEELGEKF